MPYGDINGARRVQDFSESSRLFGDPHERRGASCAIQQFFKKDGTDRSVVPIASGAVAPASVVMLDGIGGAATLCTDAINLDQWGDSLRITVDPVSATTFNLGMQWRPLMLKYSMKSIPSVRRAITQYLSNVLPPNYSLTLNPGSD